MRAPQNSALMIEVGDQGPGLPDDLAQYLVGHSEEAPGVGGGLGLWIVRRLVADEGGEIAARPGDGLSTTRSGSHGPSAKISQRAKDLKGLLRREAIHAG